METGHTVTLELLRHGPPHNQLMSPLTEYLALCGNHPATTVQVPLEHKQLLMQLRSLAYKESSEARELQLKDTSRIMGEVLAKVPGLIAELAEAPSPGQQLTHLRLILSASELALLPFELASSPNGFPGAGQTLALQSQLPLCVTREVRRVGSERVVWPEAPRILFLAAAPPDVGAIPLESHLLALRQVIDPWVRYFDEKDPADRKRKIEEHLVVLPRADVDQIQAACAACAFTHVHVLAHGLPFSDAGEGRYGLALHDPRDPSKTDIVDGSRLAALLRAPDRHGRVCGPAVVTLASCDSGAQGSVVGAGASIAHTLHEAGVPLVVGAQFPLSFAASILMVEVLYERLLWGADPRALLYDLRMQLKSRVKDTHDWASLVAYAALPATLGAQLSKVQMSQARRGINAAMDHADHAIGAMSETLGSAAQAAPDAAQLARARDKIAAAKDWLARTDMPAAEVLGLLGSTDKREAEILFRSAGTSGESRALLDSARRNYRQAFETDMSSNWALVQDLVLTAVLDGPDAIDAAKWVTANTLAEYDLYHEDRRRVAWAHGSSIELHLLASVMPPSPLYPDPAAAAIEHARSLNRVRQPSEIYTTRRQALRYVEWFGEIQPKMLPLAPLARQIFDILSEGRRFALRAAAG